MKKTFILLFTLAMSVFSFAQSQRLEPKARVGVLPFGQLHAAQTDTSSVGSQTSNAQTYTLTFYDNLIRGEGDNGDIIFQSSDDDNIARLDIYMDEVTSGTYTSANGQFVLSNTVVLYNGAAIYATSAEATILVTSDSIVINASMVGTDGNTYVINIYKSLIPNTTVINCPEDFTYKVFAANDMVVTASGDGYRIQINFLTNDLQPGVYDYDDLDLIYTGIFFPDGSSSRVSSIAVRVTESNDTTYIVAGMNVDSDVYFFYMHGVNPANVPPSYVFRLDDNYDFGTITPEEVPNQYWVSAMYHDYPETPTYTMEHDYFRLNMIEEGQRICSLQVYCTKTTPGVYEDVIYVTCGEETKNITLKYTVQNAPSDSTITNPTDSTITNPSDSIPPITSDTTTTGGNVQAGAVTFEFYTMGLPNQMNVVGFNQEPVFVGFDKGIGNNAPKYYTSGNAIRLYGGNVFVVSAMAPYHIEEIIINYASGEGTNPVTANPGNYFEQDDKAGKLGTWTGDAQDVQFSVEGNSGHRRIASMKITYSAPTEQNPSDTTVVTPSDSVPSTPTDTITDSAYTQKVMFQVPTCGGNKVEPQMVLETETETLDFDVRLLSNGWYMAEREMTGTEAGVLTVHEKGASNNEIQHPADTMGIIRRWVWYIDNESEHSFILDLRDYEWSDCKDGDVNYVSDLTFCFAQPVPGATPDTCARVLSANTAVPATVSLTWTDLSSASASGLGGTTVTTFLHGHSYRASVNMYNLLTDSLYTTSGTKITWKAGELLETNNSFMSPTYNVEDVMFTVNLSDAVIQPNGACTMTASAMCNATVDTYAFSWFASLNGEDFFGMLPIMGYTITPGNWTSSVSFPATLLPAGTYYVRVGLTCNVNGTVKNFSSNTAKVVITAGAAVEEEKITSGSITYDAESSTLTIESANTDAQTETAIANTESGTTIEVKGSSTITATETGIDTSADITITVAEDEEGESSTVVTISAPKPIFTAAENVVLTFGPVRVVLTCSAGAGAPARSIVEEDAHNEYLAPRRAIMARHEEEEGEGYSVISGFADVVFDGSGFETPGVQYSTTRKEVIDQNGNRVTSVVISPDRVTTDFEIVPAETDLRVEKFLINGVLYLQRGTKFYDVMGRLIESLND